MSSDKSGNIKEARRGGGERMVKIVKIMIMVIRRRMIMMMDII
jgi:hypothetical protein